MITLERQLNPRLMYYSNKGQWIVEKGQEREEEFGLLRVVKYEKVDKIYGPLMGFEGCSVSFVRKT